MPMRKICMLIAVMFVVTADIIGKERTNGEMLNIAREILLRRDAAKAKGAYVTLRQVVNNKQFGVFAADGYGFVVINRNDAGRTILGQSATDFDADNLPDGLKWWLESTEEALSKGITGSYYADVLNVDAVIDNFVTTRWNQGAPYNAKCPKVVSGLNSRIAPAGCVATALSQVLNYYKYPAQGKGTGIFHVTSENETKHYKMDINSVYDYNSLKDSYSESETDKEAISTLLFEVGVACGMSYRYTGSGATYLDATMALANNFSYDSLAINFYLRNCFPEEEWFTMIRSEIEARRPVAYAASDASAGGHAFLFTGLDTEGKVWVNWGWGGDGDGWFAIDHLVVKTYNFYKDQNMIIGFVPREEPTADEENTSLIYFDNKNGLELVNKTKVVYVTPYTIANYGWRFFEGVVRFVLENTTTGEIAYKTLFDEQKVLQPMYIRKYNSLTNVNNMFKETYPDGLPEGDYKLHVECKSTNEKDWKLVRRLGDFAYCSWFSVKGDGTVVVDNDQPTTAIGNVKADDDGGVIGSYDLGGRKLKGSDKTSRMVIRKKANGAEKILEKR